MAKTTIEKMQKIVKKYNGKCLSDTFIDSESNLTWECEKGHTWEASHFDIKRGKWCPECKRLKKEEKSQVKLDELHKLAKSRKGKCLSTSYKNNKIKLTWECKEGHTWDAAPMHIKKGGWCPVCTRTKKLTIEQMHEIAQDRGGLCLSNTYINANTKLTWQCDTGHTWDARPITVKKGSWCPNCRLGKSSIEDMQKLAAERGGECLSKEYINYKTRLTWKCREGHIWDTTPQSVGKGGWCPTCARERRRKKITKYTPVTPGVK
ncbi:MAG: hypothetical protein GY750_04135 [Lentisphaerae bacterium]|nr:hypothetical protein [Lentisphaerota bacterium]